MKKLLLLCTTILSLCTLSCEKPEGQGIINLPKPENLSFTANSEESLTFQWDDIEEAKCYSYTVNGNEETYTVSNTVTIDNLEPETEYLFRVKAVSGDASRWKDSEWAEIRAVTGQEQPAAFSITVQEVTFHSITAGIVPVDDNATYFCNIGKTEDLGKLGSDEEIMERDIKMLEETASANGMGFKEFCIAMRILNKGGNVFLFTKGIDADTEYTVYVFGLSYEGDITTGLVSAETRTAVKPEIQPSDMTFSFEISDITDISAKMTVTPSNDDEWYYSMFVAYDNLMAYGDSKIVEMCLEDINEHISSSDFLSVMDLLCHKGENTIAYGEFTANTEYAGFAFGVGQDGLLAGASTELFKSEKFMTNGQGQEDGPIRIEVINWGIENAEIKFIPSSDAIPYRCELLPYETFKDLDDAEIIQKDMENLWADYAEYYVMILQYSEFSIKRIMPLEPDTDYIAFAYGLSDSEFSATTGLCSKILRTPMQ